MATAPQPIPYFGRAWSIAVKSSTGQTYTLASQGTTPSLRCQFTIDTMMLAVTVFWQAQLTIYNLTKDAAQSIAQGGAVTAAGNSAFTLPADIMLQMGDQVTISAGYENGSTGAFSPVANLIYTGNILQSILTRENVTDSKLTLRLISNLAATFLNTSISRKNDQNDLQIIQQIAKDSGINIAQIDDSSQQKLQNQLYPRGQALHDRPIPLINQILKQHNLFTWLDENGIHITDPSAGTFTPKYVFGPPNLSSYTTGQTTPTTTVKTTLIGVPQQTQQGIMFKILMDNQVKIYDPIQIAPGTAINGFQFQFGTLPPVPNPQGIYLIAGLRYVGDTRGRGEDWYTEVTAMTPNFFEFYNKAFSIAKPN